MLKKVNVLIIGDSLVYGLGDDEKGGWANRLRLSLEKRNDYYYDVYNLGIPDDSSLDILTRFDREIENRYYQGELMVIYQFGANDSSQTKTDYKTFSARVKTIIQMTKKYTNKIAFINIPKAIEIDVEGRLGIIAEVRNDKINEYNLYLKEACLDEKVEYININKIIHLEDLSEDGVHPNSKGYEKISNIVYEYIDDEINNSK